MSLGGMIKKNSGLLQLLPVSPNQQYVTAH